MTWRYSEAGEDTTKSAHPACLYTLKVIGVPIVACWSEIEERPRVIVEQTSTSTLVRRQGCVH
ncbi:hypothetical protein OG21DRAFT_1514077 [Imleria badia]|nr:hypothetical protein OG21DRAFT_1514077 [Imleria badia]